MLNTKIEYGTPSENNFLSKNADLRKLECKCFKFSGIQYYGDEFIQYLKLRKRVFVDRLGWGIDSFDSVELDQFDNPKASYVVVVESGKVVAGARFSQIQNKYGNVGSMSSEVIQGNLATIPKTILSSKYLIAENWEATRLAIEPKLSFAERAECLKLLISKLLLGVKSQGGTAVITLSPTSLKRLVSKQNLIVKQIGDPYKCDEDNRKYASFLIPVDQNFPVEIPSALHSSLY